MSRADSTAAIVLVEDDLGMTRLLTRETARQGWNLRTAHSLGSARKVLADIDWDVLLLDRGLPDGSGMDLCAELRASRPTGYIIMLTGAASDEEKLEGFEGGVDDYMTKPFQLTELMARIRAGLRIVKLQKALLRSNEQLQELSLTDGLTSLRNRRAFDEELARRFGAAWRYHRPLSVALLDIDHFKAINDVRGHPAGDAVLRAVARILAQSTRQSDLVARFGGEEFAVVLPETPLLEGLQFAEKIRGAVAQSGLRAADNMQPLTLSAGVASFPHSSFQSAEELLFAADAALYRAKKNGRNRVEGERRRERYASVAPRFLAPVAAAPKPQLRHFPFTLLRSDRLSQQQ